MGRGAPEPTREERAGSGRLQRGAVCRRTGRRALLPSTALLSLPCAALLSPPIHPSTYPGGGPPPPTPPPNPPFHPSTPQPTRPRTAWTRKPPTRAAAEALGPGGGAGGGAARAGAGPGAPVRPRRTPADCPPPSPVLFPPPTSHPTPEPPAQSTPPNPQASPTQLSQPPALRTT